jgi:hypothetical protein
MGQRGTPAQPVHEERSVMRRVAVAAALAAASLLACAQARAGVHASVQVYADAGETSGLSSSPTKIDQNADDAGANGVASASWGWPFAPVAPLDAASCASTGCADRSGGATASVDEAAGILRAGAGASILVGNAPDPNFGGVADTEGSASVDDELTLSKAATVILEGTVHGTLAETNGAPDLIGDPQVRTHVAIDFCCTFVRGEGLLPLGGYEQDYSPDANDGSPTTIDDTFSVPVDLPQGTSELTADLGQTVSLLADGLQSTVLAESGLGDFTGTVTFHVVVPDDVVATSSSGLLPVVGGAPAAPSDTTAPSSAATLAPAPNDAGWNNGPVTVHVTAHDEDGGSGVASLTASTSGAQSKAATTSAGSSLDVPVTAEGTTTVTYFATDAAGNAETPHTVTVRIDETPPAVAYSGNAGSYTVDQDVAIGCAASDALSGTETSTCAGATGPAYAFGLGTHRLTATATDVAGNTGSGTTTFTVVADPASVAALTIGFVDDSPAYALLSPQQQAVADLLAAAAERAAGRLALSPDSAADGLLTSYEAALDLLARNGWLTPQQVQLLTGFARTL